MFCQNCGNKVNDNEHFCSNCGAALETLNINTTNSSYATNLNIDGNMNKVKSTFLQVVSIIMIVFASIGFIINCSTLGSVSQSLSTMLIVAILDTIAELVAGICGIANCRRPQNMSICKGCGVVWLGLCIANRILTLVYMKDLSGGLSGMYGSAFNVGAVIGFAISLVLPILYIVAVGKFENERR